MADRDSRRRLDPLHDDEGAERIFDKVDRTPHRRPRIDTEEIVRQVDAGMPDWAEFAEMRAEVKACKAARERTEKWRKPWLFLRGLGLTSIVGALVYTANVIDTRAEARSDARRQSEMVLEHEGQIRALQLRQAATDAVLQLMDTLLLK